MGISFQLMSQLQYEEEAQKRGQEEIFIDGMRHKRGHKGRRAVNGSRGEGVLGVLSKVRDTSLLLSTTQRFESV